MNYKKIAVAIAPLMLISACQGAPKNIIYSDDNKKAYQMEEVYSIGLFTPTYQWKRTSVCDVVINHTNSTPHGSGYDSRSVENCKPIGNNDGFTNDTATPVAPMLFQAGGNVAQGALIGEGLKDSGNNNAVSNNINQNVSATNCVGNCSGKKKGK